MEMTVPQRVELRGKYVVQIRSVLHSGMGWLRNLSAHGAYVMTPMVLLPQAQVRLRIVIPEEKLWVETEAVVAWENRGKVRRGGLPPGYGVRFIKMPEETAKTIRRILLGGTARPSPLELPATEGADAHTFSRRDLVVPDGPPYPLKDDIIAAVITERAKGIFVLSYDRTQDARVGRADENLRNTLMDFVGEYAYFYHEVIDEEDDRFYRECELFHRLGGDHGQLDNNTHPHPPTESNWTCPVCETEIGE